ncbi:hypothetical protein APA28_31070 [Pseudomonas aeruginosa]|nr:hypothetical protein APA28_31070 [Pseudomonas aeruginosa]
MDARLTCARRIPHTLTKKRQFPQALRLGVRAVGWDSIEIDQWIAERLNHRT